MARRTLAQRVSARQTPHSEQARNETRRLHDGNQVFRCRRFENRPTDVRPAPATRKRWNHPDSRCGDEKQRRTGVSRPVNSQRKAAIFLMKRKQTGPASEISCHLCNRGRGRRGADPLRGVIGVAWAARASMFTHEATAVTRLSSSIVGMGQRILSFSDNPDH
jgi:hypothetical protein